MYKRRPESVILIKIVISCIDVRNLLEKTSELFCLASLEWYYVDPCGIKCKINFGGLCNQGVMIRNKYFKIILYDPLTTQSV